MLRTAIIGYGGVARSHVKDIGFFSEDNPLRAADDPLVDLVACCDISPDALNAFREDTGVEALYHNVDEMLDKENLDYVHIATCADGHVDPVLACANCGVHVLCEKPLATEPSECDAMIEACDRAGVQFVISHQRQSSPLYWYIRGMLDEGAIGTFRYITGGAKSRRGGKELHNIGSHLIDAMGIFADEIDWVSAYCSIEGRACTVGDREPGDRGAGWVLGERVDLTLGYKSGVQATLNFNEDPGQFNWVLWGTEARLAFFTNSMWRCAGPETQPNESWEPVEAPAQPVPTRSGYVNPPDWVDIVAKLGAHPRVFMMREMFQRMESGGEHTSSGRIGAIPIEVMQAAFLSHLEGRRVDMPVSQRESPLK